jgi:hypothetical protein
MAAWCLLTHQSPEVYKALTAVERNAFVSVIEQRGAGQ